MNRLLLIGCLILTGCGSHSTVTVYMPSGYSPVSDGGFCMVNRGDQPLQVPNGPRLEKGQSFNAVLGPDMKWGFQVRNDQTAREDADCLVIGG